MALSTQLESIISYCFWLQVGCSLDKLFKIKGCNEPFLCIILHEDGQPEQIFLGSEQKEVCEIFGGFIQALIVLISAYYVFNCQYVKAKNLLMFLQEFLLGDPVDSTVKKSAAYSQFAKQIKP